MYPPLSALLSKSLVDRRNGHRRRVLAGFGEARRLMMAGDEERRAYQGLLLAALLNRARQAVPRVRELLLGEPEVIDAEGVWEVLARLPVMRRDEIQADPSAFRAAGFTDARPDATGGSTGTPMRFLVDEATQIARESSLYWSDSLAGWRVGERIAMLWGSDRDVRSASRDFKLWLRWQLDNRRWYNAFDMGEAEMERFHRHLQRFQPHLLVAYAGSLDVYARWLRETGRAAAGLRYPRRGLVASAEMLTESMRETIESVFGVKVYNRYGNREFGAIAAECAAHDGLHVNDADMIVEIDSPDPERVPGPLLVTYLRNQAMPFIRYDTGDLACWAESATCSCGVTTRKLARIAGRQADTIRAGNGKLIHGEYFTHLLYKAERVREFQFVQLEPDRYELRLVADEPERPELEAEWKQAILEQVGASARVDLMYVDSIPLLASGKRRFTVSLRDSLREVLSY